MYFTSKRYSARVIGCLAALVLIAGCAQTEPYRPRSDAGATLCEPVMPDDPQQKGVRPGTVSAECAPLYTEHSAFYDLHIAEFDDQGWVYQSNDSSSTAENQIDSAIDQIKSTLEAREKVRLFIFIHGWRHFAASDDSNVQEFRLFLKEMAKEANGAKVIGIYVGWRGLPILGVEPFASLTFWDRKRAAEQIAQGSVRELFGRLHALSRFRPAPPQQDARLVTKQPGKQDEAMLRTYVIAHSFGSSIAFRALSESMIESFTNDLDTNAASVSRFVDMLVLVNPAIEASRFEALYRSALKRRAVCVKAGKPFCDQPAYQSPVLAVFQSEGDWATQKAFPVAATVANVFQNEISAEEKYANRHTIGWDDRYQTHHMTHDPNGCKKPSPGHPLVSLDGVDRYEKPGWSWCVTRDHISIKHLGMLADRPIYNGPIWNIRVDSSIMADHDDIWNGHFRDVLIRMFAEDAPKPLAARQETADPD